MISSKGGEDGGCRFGGGCNSEKLFDPCNCIGYGLLGLRRTPPRLFMKQCLNSLNALS